jgi:large conductance mechanosensitive channel
MKNFVQEFKAFAMRGNVVDLAVAVVIGTAFGKIVSSLVENIVTPLIGMLLGGVNFTDWAFMLGEGEDAVILSYGVFIQSVFDFVVIALAIFVAIKALSRLQKKEQAAPEAEKVVEPTEEIKLLREIRDSLRR